ncbi:terminase family protein [candidate division WOR-3 bacterium]|nr:terminase family protein [candidate division WOR-3 bacterium]
MQRADSTALDLDYGQYSRVQKENLLALFQEKERRVNSRQILSLYPDRGPLRRELYVPHCKFFKAGAKHKERCMMAANRIGKTYGVGGYELTLHLTGQYPPWWEGRKFDRPVRTWACGTTGQTVRDIIQRKLLGPINDLGTGLIPGEYIVETKKKAGNVPDTIETVYVKHITGGISTMGLKSYEQGRKAFEGDEQDVVLLDEEPPIGIYTECLTRTMTTQGIVMLLFTPLQGLSDTVLLFMPGGQIPAETGRRFVVQATWDDAPHLTEQDKQDIIDSYLPHERDARSKGIPQLGSGRIYPIPEEDLLVDDFAVPKHWIQAYGFDVGWKATAATWGALNRESDVLYLHSCYKKGEEKPIIHAEAVKAHGEWVPGLSDPAALGRGQKDGTQLMLEYNDLGLKLVPAENPVEAGILKLYKRMTTGRLKVFKSMVQWLEEFRIYRRDDKGRVVKDFDHLMDTTRYLNNSIVSVGIVRPESKEIHIPGSSSSLTSGWAR